MATRERPLIGVTGPNRGGGPAWLFTRLALWRAGARARRVTSRHPIDPSELDGLVIGGGADVTEPLPAGTVTTPPPSMHVRWPRRVLDLLLAPLVLLIRLIGAVRPHGIDKGRDVLEAGLLRFAQEEGLPVLGICRGSQLMNVVAGGTLVRDLRALYNERPDLYTVLPRREVTVQPDSLLHGIVGRPNLLVNSLHFHAVDDAAPGFRVAAREPSGVTQAIERVGSTFWLGVQWHPEYLPQQEVHQRIFRALVAAARQHQAHRSRRELEAHERERRRSHGDHLGDSLAV